MSADQASPAVEQLARQLREEAEDLTDRWLEGLNERLGVRPRRLLPTQALRDHVPDVLRSAADYLRPRIDRLPNEAIDILRSVAQLRREQGYDVQELLIEFDVLADLIFDWAAQWADEMGDELSGGDAMRAAARLDEVLRQVATVAVGTYREEEIRQSQELSERLGEFARTLGHELTNPLHTAGLSIEMLSDDEVAGDAEKRREHVGVIRDRLARIRHLVDDVQTLAAAESARGNARWVPLDEVVRSVLKEVEDSAEEHGVEIRVDEPLGDFEVDAVRVEIALMNLVTNAIKFCDPDEDERWVRISASPAESEGLEGGRRVSVEDNGRGIAEESHSNVFQRFFRGIPEVEGTGLGLAISKRVIEQRGGRLWFESTLGEGTTFHLEIPRRLKSGEDDPEEVGR